MYELPHVICMYECMPHKYKYVHIRVHGIQVVHVRKERHVYAPVYGVLSVRMRMYAGVCVCNMHIGMRMCMHVSKRMCMYGKIYTACVCKNI